MREITRMKQEFELLKNRGRNGKKNEFDRGAALGLMPVSESDDA